MVDTRFRLRKHLLQYINIIIAIYTLYANMKRIYTLVSQHKSRTAHGSMRVSTKLHREARNSDASTCGQVEFTMGVDRERRY